MLPVHCVCPIVCFNAKTCFTDDRCTSIKRPAMQAMSLIFNFQDIYLYDIFLKDHQNNK